MDTASVLPPRQRNLPFPPGFFGRLYSLAIRHRFRTLGEGSYIRPPATIRNPGYIAIGSSVLIREHCWLNVTAGDPGAGPTLMIGDGTYIGRFAHINAYRQVLIETDVLIADRVFISDVDHVWTDPNMPIVRQPVAFGGPVILETGCWIGIGVAILPGVRIGRNAVVGANAVVAHDVPACTVVGGVPARPIVSTRKPQ